MATNITWEKSQDNTLAATKRNVTKRYAYAAVGLGLIVVVGYLLYNAMATGRYYMTVDDLVTNPVNADKNVRVSGAVIGESIVFDQANGVLTFTVVNIPSDADTIKEMGGLGEVLHQAVNNPSATRLEIVWENADMPDLLKNEAQAIMTGKLGDDGKFYASEVLLKCPTRYSDEAPQQVVQ